MPNSSRQPSIPAYARPARIGAFNASIATIIEQRRQASAETNNTSDRDEVVRSHLRRLATQERFRSGRRPGFGQP